MKKITILSILYNYELELLGKERGIGTLKERNDYIDELSNLMAEEEIISLLPDLLAKRSKKKTAGIGKGFLFDQLYNYELERLAGNCNMNLPEGVTEKNRDLITEELSRSFSAPKLKAEFDRIFKMRGRKIASPPKNLRTIISRISNSLYGFEGKTTRSLVKTLAVSLPDTLKERGIQYRSRIDGNTIKYGSFATILVGYGKSEKSDMVNALIGKALLLTRKARFIVLVIKDTSGNNSLRAVERGYLQNSRIYVMMG